MQQENLNVHLVQFSPEWGEIKTTLEGLEKLIVESFGGKDVAHNAPTNG